MNQYRSLPLICPCCSKSFESFQLRHPLKSGIQYTDFFKPFLGAQPLNFSIHTCPYCGFSGQENEFSQNNLKDDLKEKIKSKLKPLVNNQNLFSGQQYEFASMIAQWRGDSYLNIARLHLKAAWCYRNARVQIGEKKCLKKAIAAYTRAFENDQIPKEEKSQNTYLIGELYRRIGNSEQAAEWFDKAREIALSEEEDEWIAELAVQQKTNPQDYFQHG